MPNTEELLATLNDRQREAASHTEGPLLILAGAGSGKTRVLTYRIAYLIEQGIPAWQILAITFTNKAAGEMRERVDGLLGTGGANVFVSTFHSMCVRFLRREIDRLGYSRDFTIYDADDQRTFMKQVIRDLNLDSKMYRERAVLSVISSAKNEMIDAEQFAAQASDLYSRSVAKLYAEYEKQLKKNNALDFDDLLLLTVGLFKEFPEVLSGYQERFRYIMVDEYQDTNTVQFELVRLLSERYRNLCVVGDDDQSIYKFRGANIENILSFERSFPGARVIKLEQNYRSTKQILAAANEVIRNNRGRKDKTLWTANEEGEKPQYQEYETAGAEADAIVKEAFQSGFALKDQAVLYRTNAQSRLLEEKCIQRNVPYIIVGGVNFYQRREIKDILSYLRVIANSVDDLACMRVLNVPKRGIGQTTADRAADYAARAGIGLYDALLRAGDIPGVNQGTAKKISGFTGLIEDLRKRAAAGASLKDLILAVRDETGYAEELKKEGEIEAETRMENIDELINKAVSFEEAHPSQREAAASPDAASNGLQMLASFLEEVSLLSDLDRRNDTDDVLTMMTLHAAKGLEFDKVYLCGMEEGLFPSQASINADDPEAEVEEERRLCYVGITRARKSLRLSSARERMIHGETRYERPSRFIEELSDETCDRTFLRGRAASWKDFDDDFDNPIPRRGFGGNGVSGGYSRAGKETLFSAGGGFARGTTVYSDGYGTYPPAGSAGSAGGIRTGLYGSLDTGSGAKRGAQTLKKGAEITKKKPDYETGDRVSHIKYGEGTVTEIKDGQRDYEVTVDFDTAGTKRMLAGFAKLQKV
ncbi:MAG: UvrD-helicase domain-containing protein [Eubacteriales bacterium]|nr:UvrD-helicase domain-containing protein [Eubacteriales bacterium]